MRQGYGEPRQPRQYPAPSATASATTPTPSATGCRRGSGGCPGARRRVTALAEYTITRPSGDERQHARTEEQASTDSAEGGAVEGGGIRRRAPTRLLERLAPVLEVLELIVGRARRGQKHTCPPAVQLGAARDGGGERAHALRRRRVRRARARWASASSPRVRSPSPCPAKQAPQRRVGARLAAAPSDEDHMRRSAGRRPGATRSSPRWWPWSRSPTPRRRARGRAQPVRQAREAVEAGLTAAPGTPRRRAHSAAAIAFSRLCPPQRA